MPLTFVLQEHFVEILFRQLESFENQESNLSNFNFAKLPHVLASFACLFWTKSLACIALLGSSRKRLESHSVKLFNVRPAKSLNDQNDQKSEEKHF